MKNAAEARRVPALAPHRRVDRHGQALFAAILLGAATLGPASARASQQAAQPARTPAAPSLEETRLTMGKWSETQQILSRERKEWQQGKEILVGRVELIEEEVAALEEKIEQARASVAEVERKRAELRAQNEQLESAGERLAEAVGALESGLRQLSRTIPAPIHARIQPLFQRMPEDPSVTRVSVAERFQNVLGMFNELNKANNEISVSFEVRELAEHELAEVRVLYVGLAQAYYVSASGEAGIGRPTAEGWQWEPSKTVAADVLLALEVLQGKHTPAFVPLPVTIQ